MTAQDKVWKVVRGLRDFTIEELSQLTEEKQKTVMFYTSLLCKAGYIRFVGKRKAASGWPQRVYRLVRNTGPKTPMQKRCLYDPNTDTMAEIKETISAETGGAHVD